MKDNDKLGISYKQLNEIIKTLYKDSYHFDLESKSDSVEITSSLSQYIEYSQGDTVTTTLTFERSRV